MKDLRKFCETIGLDAKAFYLSKNEFGMPLLCSEYYMQRMIEFEDPDEEEVLEQAAILYQNGISQLVDEYNLIVQFLETFYGKETDSDANIGD